MNSPSSHYLRRFLLERKESPIAKSRRQQAQANPSKKRRKQEQKMVKKYDENNPQSRKDRDAVKTAKEHPNGETAKKLKARGLNIKNQKCSECGSTQNLQADHEKQSTNGDYNSKSRLRWLCNSCHQKKTAKKRKQLGQQENQYGHAMKSESFDKKLSDALSLLVEADKEKRERQRAKKEIEREQGKIDQPKGGQSRPGKGKGKGKPQPKTTQMGEYEFIHEPERPAPPTLQQQAANLAKGGEEDVLKGGRSASRSRGKRKVAGRRILPKYKMDDENVLFARQHPEYPEVYEIINRSINAPAYELHNQLMKIDIHRTYHLKNGGVITGQEEGIEEEKVYQFNLIDGSTLVTKSYDTTKLTHHIKDFENGEVLHGQIVDVQQNYIIFNRFLKDGKTEQLQLDINQVFKPSGTQRVYYRYGPPSDAPQPLRRFWVNPETNERKYEFEATSDRINLGGLALSQTDIDRDEIVAQLITQENRLSQSKVNNLLNQSKRGKDEFAQLLQSDERLGVDALSPQEVTDYYRRATPQQQPTPSELERRAHEMIKHERPLLNPDSAEYKNVLKKTRSRIAQKTAMPREKPKGLQWHVEPRDIDNIAVSLKEDLPTLGAEHANLVNFYMLKDVKIENAEDESFLKKFLKGYRADLDKKINNRLIPIKAEIPQSALAEQPEPISQVIRKVKVADDFGASKIQFLSDDEIAKTDDGNPIIDDNDQAYFTTVKNVIQNFKDAAQSKLTTKSEDERQKQVELINQAIEDVLPKEGESGIEHMDRNGIMIIPLTSTVMDNYDFYERSLKTEPGKDYKTEEWPVLEKDEVRQNPGRVRFAIPKVYNVADTVDARGNLIAGQHYDWIEKLAPSQNFDDFGIRKAGSKTKAKVKFKTFELNFDEDIFSPEQFMQKMIQPHLERMDPTQRKNYLDRHFAIAYTDQIKGETLRQRAMNVWAVNKAIGDYGGPDSWLSIKEEERIARIKKAREELENRRNVDENFEKELRAKSREIFQMQVMADLDRAIGEKEFACPICRGQKYRKTKTTRYKGLPKSAISQKPQFRPELQQLLGVELDWEPATANEYEKFKTSPEEKATELVMPCTGCGGTGQEMSNNRAYITMGSKKKYMNSDEFNKALDGSLKAGFTKLMQKGEVDPDRLQGSGLISRTVSALFPPSMRELVRTNIPQTQIKPFVNLLKNKTQKYLMGNPKAQPTEGEGLPLKLTKEGNRMLGLFEVSTQSGRSVKFGYPLQSSSRFVRVRELDDKDLEKEPHFIEAKEDRESYMLSNVANLVRAAYEEEVGAARKPQSLIRLEQDRKVTFAELDPKSRAAYLNGLNAQEKSELIEYIQEADAPETISEPSKSPLKPWYTKSILKVKSVTIKASSAYQGDVHELARKFAELDGVELDPAELKSLGGFSNIDSYTGTVGGMFGGERASDTTKKYHAIAQAYLIALNEAEYTMEEFFNDNNVLGKYLFKALGGFKVDMEPDKRDRGLALLVCDDVTTGKEVVLRFDLEKEPDAQVLRVWPYNKLKSSKTPKRSQPPETKYSNIPDTLMDQLRRKTKGRVKLFLFSPPEAPAKKLSTLAKHRREKILDIINKIDPNRAKQIKRYLEPEEGPEPELEENIIRDRLESISEMAELVGPEIDPEKEESLDPSEIAQMIDDL